MALAGSWRRAGVSQKLNWTTMNKLLKVQIRRNASWTKAKKFWKSASVAQTPLGYAVQIDERQVKTPTGIPIVLPEDKKLLAHWVASEWESINDLKPYSLPLVLHLMC
jgi:chaperone required for assembly of F1-ATPase